MLTADEIVLELKKKLLQKDDWLCRNVLNFTGVATTDYCKEVGYKEALQHVIIKFMENGIGNCSLDDEFK